MFCSNTTILNFSNYRETRVFFLKSGRLQENLWLTLWGGLVVGEQAFLSPLGPHPRLSSYLQSPWGSGWAAAFLWHHFLGKRFQCLDFISQ